jgi:microcystin-dependent protein
MWPSITYTFSPSTIAKSSEVNQNFSDILAEIVKGIPTGSGKLWFTDSVPSGWLLCDGSAVSRTTYARLFAVIGTIYGSGDGSTTFNLPNFKGRVPVGKDIGQSEFDSLGESGGEKAHTLTQAEMPEHNHDDGTLTASSAGEHGHPVRHRNDRDTNLNVDVGKASPSDTGQGSLSTNTSLLGNAGAHGHDVSGNTGNAGSGNAHNNLQPYRVTNYIIKD